MIQMDIGEFTDLLRCSMSGNPCGTDTWSAGSHCQCNQCTKWVLSQLAALTQERDKLREVVRELLCHLRPCHPSVGANCSTCKVAQQALALLAPSGEADKQGTLTAGGE